MPETYNIVCQWKLKNKNYLKFKNLCVNMLYFDY